jgi:hypothetical protein
LILDAHLRAHARFSCFITEHPRFKNTVSEWLLTVNRLSQVHSGHSRRRVRMIWSRHCDQVDRVANSGKQLAIVTKGAGLRVQLLAASQILSIHIADSGNFHLIVTRSLSGVRGALATNADVRRSQLAIRRICPQSGGQNAESADCTCLNELAPFHGVSELWDAIGSEIHLRYAIVTLRTQQIHGNLGSREQEKKQP